MRSVKTKRVQSIQSCIATKLEDEVVRVGEVLEVATDLHEGRSNVTYALHGSEQYCKDSELGIQSVKQGHDQCIGQAVQFTDLALLTASPTRLSPQSQ